MNHLDAIRNFANPGYTPTRGTIRIYDAKWYVCTFQNTETDQGGGHYLAEGEYSQVLPGKEARKARDAQLNHLNTIREHTGKIWKVTGIQGYWPTFHATEAEAEAERDKQAAQNATDAEKALAYLNRQINWTDEEMLAFYGLCHGWPGHEAKKIAERRTDLAQQWQENKAFWQKPITIERIR